MKTVNLLSFVLLGFFVGCGEVPEKTPTPSNNPTNNPVNNPNNTNNPTTNNTTIGPNNSSNNPNNLNNLNNSNNSNNSNNLPNNLNNPNSPPNNLNNPTNNTMCGDGVVQTGEQCDGAALVTCQDLGFAAGTVICSSDCTHDVTGCHTGFCGDGEVQVGEDCDGSLEVTCQDLGFTGGTLTCSNQCTHNTSQCTRCGDGVVQAGEACDDGALNGTYGSCNSTCTGPGPRCGDGIVNGNEACDGSTTASCTFVGGAGVPVCSSTCTIDYSACTFPPGPPSVGQIVITELMPDPVARLDNVGEWFEVYNSGTSAVDLVNCEFVSATSSGFETIVINQSMIVNAGAFATFARSSDAGFAEDWNYNFGLNLNNTNDDLQLNCPVTASSAMLREIDYVQYSNPPAGASISLQPPYSATLNNFAENWCNGKTAYATGDLGTPGGPNPTCP